MRRMLRQPLLNDHAADRMPDQDRLDRADLRQEILQGIGQVRNADGGQWRRAAIARHVPGDGAKAIAEKFELAAPRPRRAANSVQEHQRRQIGIAGGLIGEAAVPGLDGRKIGHAGLPVLADTADATRPRRMKKRKF